MLLGDYRPPAPYDSFSLPHKYTISPHLNMFGIWEHAWTKEFSCIVEFEMCAQNMNQKMLVSSQKSCLPGPYQVLYSNKIL